VVINAKPDYDARSSPATSRPSARPASAQASRRFKSAVLKRLHVNQVVHHLADNNNNVVKDKKGNNKVCREEHRELDKEDGEKELERLRRRLDRGLAFQLPQSGGKHHHRKDQNPKDQKGNRKERDQYE